MEDMRRAAFESVARACGFVSLGIFCLMFGLSFEPRLALKAGGLLAMLTALVLAFKAREALTKDYRRTEMWLLLPKVSRPPAALAQRLSGTVLRETYLTFALWAAAIAVCLWAVAFVLVLLGR